MAPWLRRSAATATPKNMRGAPVRPSGDLGSRLPIWNGGLGPGDEVSPSSSSNMRFPAGDAAIVDDCSSVFSPQRRSPERQQPVDQEKSIGLIMTGRPAGVSKPRPQNTRTWEMNYLRDGEDFAPLPSPDEPVPLEHSPHQSPRPWSLDIGRYGNYLPGSASYGGYQPGSASTLSQFAFVAEGSSPDGPAPSSPDRPGSQLPWLPSPASPATSPRRQDSRTVTTPRQDSGVDAVQAHLLMLQAQALQGPPMVLPAPTSPNPFHEPAAVPQPPLRPVEQQQEHLVFGEQQQNQQEQPPTPTSRQSQGKPKMRKSVSFGNLQATSYVEVVPYSEIYGEHPKTFHFDGMGNKVQVGSASSHPHPGMAMQFPVGMQSPTSQPMNLNDHFPEWDGHEDRGGFARGYDSGFEQRYQEEPLYG